MAITKEKLDRALNPRTVAVAGAKRDMGYSWLKSMSTVQGKVYSVQIDPDEIPGIEELGIPNYSRVSDIPDEVDYVVIAVPRRVAPIILRDCIAKGVGGVGMFTSGFAETNEPEGIQLQEEITRLAQEADLVLLGPNCMGLYNPRLGVRFGQEQPVGSTGPVTFISQSGGHAASFITAATANGIGINKVVSFGNGVVLENADYLEYFAGDDETQVIGMYIEGLKDGRRFFQALRQAAARKPVVIWKGGQTEAGKRATSSHTGSLAESADIWDSVIRQCGAVRADSLDDAVDIIKALSYLPRVTGEGVGLTGGSGGQSVSMTDAFAAAGLDVPLFTEESYAQLRSFFQLIGASYMNPIDVGGMNRPQLQSIMDILVSDANIDIVAVQLAATVLRGGGGGQAEETETLLDVLIRTRQTFTKPLVAMLFTPDPYGHGEELQALENRLQEARIPGFPSYDRAARALKKLVAYYRFHEQGERASAAARGPAVTP